MIVLPSLLVLIALGPLAQCMRIESEDLHEKKEHKPNENGLIHKLSRSKRQYAGCPDYVAVDCQHFKRCANGIFYDYTCPAGTHFDSS